jgi:hypothetical protein
MSTRLLTLTTAALLLSACAGTEEPLEEPLLQARFNFNAYFVPDAGPIVGAEIALHDHTDLVTPLDSAMTGDDGWADLEVSEWPEERFVLHASADGFRDSWAWAPAWVFEEQTEDFWLGNFPIIRDDVWAAQHEQLGITPDPERGLLGVDALPDMTLEIDRDATIYYLGSDRVIDPSLTSSPIGQALVVDLEPGELTFTSTTPEETITWTVEIFADALSVAATHPR